MMAIPFDSGCAYVKAIQQIMLVDEIADVWFSLFEGKNKKQTFSCLEDQEHLESQLDMLLHIEISHFLILDIDLLERTVIYFCKVHLNAQVCQLKYYVLEKPKTFRLRHTQDENFKPVSKHQNKRVPMWNL